VELNDLAAFVSVVRAGGFRDAARISGVSASSLSIAVRRLESRLGLRLLNRTTRSVAPTEAGLRLVDKLTPLFSEMEAALDVLNVFRDKPTGTLKLNVPSSAARIVLPALIAAFLKAYPDIRVEVVVEDGFVDVLSIGCDAGIRYDERLEQDMIAVDRLRLRAISTHMGDPIIRASCSPTPACAANLAAARCRPGNSSGTARWCG
jgi:DNA-binding transcriptional LysR family regulator